MNEYRFCDLEVGKEQEFRVKVTEEKMHHFLSMSGDNNPLHQQDDYARRHGFKDRVVYGFLTTSFYSTLVGVYLPGKYALLQEVKKISFGKPVYIDDELTVHGAISFMNEAYKVIEIKAMIKNQNFEIVSKAKINVGLLDEVHHRDISWQL